MRVGYEPAGLEIPAHPPRQLRHRTGSVLQCGECPLEERDYAAAVDEKMIVGGIVVNQVLLTVRHGTTRAQVIELARSVRGQLVGQMPSLRHYQLEVPTRTVGELDAVIGRLRKHRLVEDAWYNLVLPSTATGTPKRR